MSALESRYRAALRWYPADWRARNGDAMLGTLLDAAEAEGRDAPTAAERRDLALNGLRARGLTVVPETVRHRAATLALGVGSGLAAIQFFAFEWAPWVTPEDRAAYLLPLERDFGPFVSAGAAVDLLWLAAFVLGMVGLRVAMRVALGLSVIASVAMLVLPASSPWISSRPSLGMLLSMAVLAATTLLGRPGRDARSTGWLALAFAGCLAGVVVILQSTHPWGAFPPPGYMATRIAFSYLHPEYLAVALLVVVAAFAIARQGRWIAAVGVGLGPWWITAFAALSAYDRTELLVPVVLALLFVALLGVRAAGIRVRISRAGAERRD